MSYLLTNIFGINVMKYFTIFILIAIASVVAYGKRLENQIQKDVAAVLEKLYEDVEVFWSVGNNEASNHIIRFEGCQTMMKFRDGAYSEVEGTRICGYVK